jgi:hypothetical protein
MKLDEHIIETDRIELPAGEYSHSYAQKVIGRTILHKGHTVYLINLITGEMTIAKIERTDLYINRFSSKGLSEYKKDDVVEVPENCIPICSLNKRNALKKFFFIAKDLFPKQ